MVGCGVGISLPLVSDAVDKRGAQTKSLWNNRRMCDIKKVKAATSSKCRRGRGMECLMDSDEGDEISEGLYGPVREIYAHRQSGHSLL